MFTLGAALLGWITGMCINYLADVMPTDRSLMDLSCPNCKTRQPIIRYWFWLSRCFNCGAQRSIRTWIVALVFTLASIWLVLRPPAGLSYFFWLIILLYLGLVWVIDQEHRLILNTTSVVGVIIALVAGSLRIGLPATLVGGLVGFTLMLGLYLFGIIFARLVGRVRGTALHEAAMGFGDVLLGLIIGLLVGWPSIFQSLLVTIISAGVFSLVLILLLLVQHRYHIGTAFPYGPFMILGAIYVLFL